MSVDLLSLGKHNLDISNIEITAQQLCERLDINIAIGKWDDGKFFPDKTFERHPGVPFYRMQDNSDEWQPVQFYLDPPQEYINARKGDICFMVLSKESVYIDFWAVSWRWKWFWSVFGDDYAYKHEYKSALADIMEYRKIAKQYYTRLGASYIYYYADQGPSDLIGDYEDGTWEEFENAIRTGKYLDDHAEYLEKEWPGFTSKDLVIFNVSDYLTKKSTEPSHSWWDIFYDDFSDLE